jgi:hypothetical protein
VRRAHVRSVLLFFFFRYQSEPIGIRDSPPLTVVADPPAPPPPPPLRANGSPLRRAKSQDSPLPCRRRPLPSAVAGPSPCAPSSLRPQGPARSPSALLCFLLPLPLWNFSIFYFCSFAHMELLSPFTFA